MTDFDVSFVGAGPEGLDEQIDSLTSGISEKTDEALKETAQEIKEDIEDTAPVDTGDYRDSWYIVEGDEETVFILSDGNAAPHNKYLLLPNQNFVGSPGADIPSQGIYHNVKGVAESHQTGLKNNLSNILMDFFESQ